jgi:hypothetical protein
MMRLIVQWLLHLVALGFLCHYTKFYNIISNFMYWFTEKHDRISHVKTLGLFLMAFIVTSLQSLGPLQFHICCWSVVPLV